MRELKRYKEELAVIGLLSLVLLAVRWVSATVWPTTGQYDLAAETETVFWVGLRLVIYTLLTWVGLRVVAPRAYNWLKHEIVDRFDDLTSEQKTSYSMRMYAILFFGLMLLALGGCASAATCDARTCVVESASADVGVRELTGKNDGPEVERYLAHVGLGKGYPWCAAFVSYHLSTCGVPNPLSAWSPAYATAAKQVWTPRKASRSPLPGDVFSLYYSNLKRVGHVGFVQALEGRYITTVEGNTNGPGSREGDGVYSRKRELSKVHAITSYIPDAPAAAGRSASGAVRAGRMQDAKEHTAHRGAARQRGGLLAAQRHGDHRAEGQRSAACAFATTWSELAAGASDRRQCHGRAVHPGRPGQGAMPVRQLGPGGEAVGAVAEGELLSPGSPGGSDRGDTDAQVGVVDAGLGLTAHVVAPLAAAETIDQTPLT
ncbi:MAG: CHAP domain-containing protein [Flavobacteriales bacterium]|nr:CHAP domain-containing protein [Flavobacteriales bacterium]